eukprot:365622-Chlamydomonas_euryale.AAC.8
MAAAAASADAVQEGLRGADRSTGPQAPRAKGADERGWDAAAGRVAHACVRGCVHSGPSARAAPSACRKGRRPAW